ncbi:hypothetical protein [Roseibacillus ishigakijimensis]|nr:hypothetical protein [Roseibacillus ishigakijimensis]
MGVQEEMRRELAKSFFIHGDEYLVEKVGELVSQDERLAAACLTEYWKNDAISPWSQIEQFESINVSSTVISEALTELARSDLSVASRFVLELEERRPDLVRECASQVVKELSAIDIKMASHFLLEIENEDLRKYVSDGFILELKRLNEPDAARQWESFFESKEN